MSKPNITLKTLFAGLSIAGLLVAPVTMAQDSVSDTNTLSSGGAAGDAAPQMSTGAIVGSAAVAVVLAGAIIDAAGSDDSSSGTSGTSGTTGTTGTTGTR